MYELHVVQLEEGVSSEHHRWMRMLEMIGTTSPKGSSVKRWKRRKKGEMMLGMVKLVGRVPRKGTRSE